MSPAGSRPSRKNPRSTNTASESALTEIWVEEGKPGGRALNHWLRAKWELEQARNPREQVDRLEQDFVERNKDK